MKTNLSLGALLLLCTLLMYDVSAQNSKIDSSKVQTLRIDPTTAVGAPVSSIFDEVEFIPLETTKESLFGRINQLEILDNRYIIYDYDTRAVLIFNAQGKYINKITNNKLPINGNEKTELYGFGMQTVNGQRYIRIYTSKGSQYFDSDGKFVMKEDQKSEEIFDKFEVGTAGNYYRNGYSKNDKDTVNYHLALFDKDNKELGLFFRFDALDYRHDQFMVAGTTFCYNTSNKDLLYTTFYDYRIYRGNADGLYMAYKMVFPLKNTLPKDFVTNSVYKNKRFDYFRDHPDQIYGIANMMCINDNLVFKLGGGKDIKKILSYNLKTGELISLNDLEPDAMTAFLPVTDGDFGYDFRNSGFLLNRDGYLYTSYSSLAAFKFKELSAGKKPVYSAVLSEFFKTQSVKNNPLLIKLKTKQK